MIGVPGFRPAARPAIVRRVTIAATTAVVALVVFVPVQVGFRAATGAAPSRGAWVAAAALVALLVPVLRPVADHVADRLAYGPGGDPYAVVAGFVARVSDTLAVDDVLPHLARTAAQVVQGPAGDVHVWLEDGREWHESWRVPGQREPHAAPLVTVPLAHHGSAVGEIDVTLPGADVSPAARELLQSLAGPAGVAVSNVRLTVALRRRLAEAEELAEELRLSRERLVQARTAQRLRLAADVQRRVQAPLAALDAALSGPAEQVDWNAARETALTALEALRELAHGVYPPVLAMSGLAAALELRLAPAGIPLEVTGDAAARCGEQVESVAYFCCLLLLDDVLEEPAPDARVTLAVRAEGVRLAVQRPALGDATLVAVRDRVDPADGTAMLTSLPDGRDEVLVTLPGQVSR